MNIYWLSSKNIKSLGLQLIVNPILELQFLVKVKPKKLPPSIKNKKQSIFQVDLKGLTYWDLFKFEYKAKRGRTGRESQSNIYEKKLKMED